MISYLCGVSCAFMCGMCNMICVGLHPLCSGMHSVAMSLPPPCEINALVRTTDVVSAYFGSMEYGGSLLWLPTKTWLFCELGLGMTSLGY
jgi:hypothetical protein